MNGHQTLIARVALSLFMGSVSIATCSISRLRNLSNRSFDRLVIVVFIGSRLATYAGVFLILHMAPRGDVFGSSSTIYRIAISSPVMPRFIRTWTPL
jgi:hypothetical protein